MLYKSVMVADSFWDGIDAKCFINEFIGSIYVSYESQPWPNFSLAKLSRIAQLYRNRRETILSFRYQVVCKVCELSADAGVSMYLWKFLNSPVST